MKKRNLLMVCGDSGTGKSTLFDRGEAKHLPKGLLQLNPKVFAVVISATTRPPRPGEINGVHYYFMSEEEFLSQDMIESVQFNGNYYGVPASEFERIPADKDILLVVEPNGALQIAKYIYENKLDINPMLIHMNIPMKVIRENLERDLLGNLVSELESLESFTEKTDNLQERIVELKQEILDGKKSIKDRTSRGNINADLIKLLPEMNNFGLDIDLSVKVLNENTSESVYQWYLINRYM